MIVLQWAKHARAIFVTIFSIDVFGLGVCLAVMLAAASALFFLWRRAVANEECFNCHHALGTRYAKEQVRSELQGIVYRKYRVCQHCGARLLIKEFVRRQPE